MIKINVKKGETYAVTSSTGCTLTYEKDGQMRILGSAEAGTQVGFVAPAEVVYCDDDTVDVTLFNGALASQAGRGGGSSSGGGLSSAERLMLTGAAQRDSDNTFTASNTFTGSVDMSTAQVTPPSGWNVGELTAEEIQEVVPIKWGDGSYYFGTLTGTGGNSVGLGYNVQTTQYSVSVGSVARCNGVRAVAVGNATSAQSYCVVVGENTIAQKNLGVTIGARFGEMVDNVFVARDCTTEGTGSITIGAGANTLNNGDTESSNSVTIGCKAENKGADSVVIGAQASGAAVGSVVMGAGAKTAATNAVALGRNAQCGSTAVAVGAQALASGYYAAAFGAGANALTFACTAIGGAAKGGTYSTSVGYRANAKGNYCNAFGIDATANDYGATVIRSTAEDGTYTQLYFSGANTPLANTYHGGAPMLGYVTKDSAGNIVAAGTRSLIDLLTDNSTFAPASLDENGEWVMPKVFHPSDLDMPQEEPQEPDEYTPLPVWPIVEPEIEEMP